MATKITASNSHSLRAVLFATACAAAFVATPAQAETPMGENVVAGAATFDRTGTTRLNINQSTDRVIIDWDTYNISTTAKVEYFQPSTTSLAVNRVVGEGEDPSRIMGTLKANGRVVILDRNGIIFGRDSHVDVNGIIASTGDVNDAEIMSGGDTFGISNFADATITARGTMTIAEGGLAALVAPRVRNYGVINARLGRVSMAAGEAVTVDLYGDDLITLAADPTTTEAVLEQRGTIDAEGGTIQMTANAASRIVNNLVNVTGVTKASSATMQGGKIVLSAGRVNVGGKVDVSGGDGNSGGTIDITSRNDTYIRDEGQLVTSEGGEIIITSGDDIHFYGPEISSFGIENAVDTHGGDVDFYADGSIIIDEDQIIDADGGDILFTSFDGLFAAPGTIRTRGEGYVDVDQDIAITRNELNTIQAAIDAIVNNEDGTTVIRVGAGDWSENITVGGKNISNIVLLGANEGEDARDAGEFTDDESVIAGATFEYMNSAYIDGFYIGYPNHEEPEPEPFGSSLISGLKFEGVQFVEANNNIIRAAEGNSILVKEADTFDAAQNNIDPAGNLKGAYAGIFVQDVNHATIVDNQIANSADEAGIYIDRDSFTMNPEIHPISERTVYVAGNQLFDNTVGMFFGAGNIDLTGPANEIYGGTTGIVFAPSSEFVGESEEPTPTYLALVDNTIGQTYFEDQGLFYIELRDGALFAPGLPTVIDASNATFVTPFGTFTGVSTGLTPLQRLFAEFSIVDFNDDPTLGLFFLGPDAPEGDEIDLLGFNIEDTFRNAYAAYVAGKSGPGFTITGLPSTGFGQGLRGFGLPNNLNDITPAAGGDGNSGNPSDLNNIVPAAGGNNTSCWQDAVQGAAQGQPTTYNMSSDPAGALNEMAACGA
ncbi:MAG: filamentous hemagglutinin N-terminal domain-containing protein [Alphaproteobacteria bacterium]|nr:filamentous hemagglutinin N-terminal domain-containing protein [Alphaproteobacteria bacterium]